MSNSILKDFVILCLFFAGAWLAFTVISNNWDAPDISLTSDGNNEKIGNYIHDLLMHDYNELENDSLTQITQLVFQRLKPTLDTPHVTFKIHLLEGSTTNAFATTNGNLYFFHGMLKMCETPEVLAAVMAHEMGHLVHNDFTNRLKKEIGLTAALTILSGGDPGTIAELGKSIFGLSYDREQEKNADIFASKTLKKANINPNRLTQLFLKLQRETDSDLYDESMQFLMTHPHLKYRIEEAAKFEIDEHFQEIPIEISNLAQVE